MMTEFQSVKVSLFGIIFCDTDWVLKKLLVDFTGGTVGWNRPGQLQGTRV